MTKKEIARMISDEVELTHQKTHEVVQRFLDVLIEVLANEGQVELRNFGVFKVKDRPARTGRNPRTGQKISIPEKSAISFKPGKEMERRVEQFKSRRSSHSDSLSAENSDRKQGSSGTELDAFDSLADS